MAKLWVDNKLYSVESEVRGYIDRIETEKDVLIRKLEAKIKGLKTELSTFKGYG